MAAKQVRNAAGLSDEQIEILRDRLERLRAELRTRIARESAVPRETEKFVEPLEAAEQTREQDDAISSSSTTGNTSARSSTRFTRFDGLYGISEVRAIRSRTRACRDSMGRHRRRRGRRQRAPPPGGGGGGGGGG